MEQEHKEIATAQWAAATIEAEDQRKALMACARFNENQTDDNRHAVVLALPAIRDLVETQKRAEAICKAIKEITEKAVYAVKDEALQAKLFKFDKPRVTRKVTNPQDLFSLMLAEGVPADKILEHCTISVKEGALCMGWSEEVFCDTFADQIDTTTSKPAMKAI